MILKSSIAAIGVVVITITGWVGTNFLGNGKVTEHVSETRIGTNIGDEAPEIVMNNPDGVEMKLSKLRGKLVLLDFWASWCGPCRRENTNVLKAYDKYKRAKFKSAKGFEIFSVSLDSNIDSWKAAIAKDGLKWDYHVSDLKKWQNEAAAMYGVSSIPMSFLIDENGIIVAKNLRGFDLHVKIDEHRSR